MSILRHRMTRKRHPHADLIHAWAEGAEIEFRVAPKPGRYGSTTTWHPCHKPDWHPNFEYRIKNVANGTRIDDTTDSIID